jgi:hypothetical protein
MPLIGDVGKYMAGSATVTALYAGDAKVWPLGPAADYTTVWRQNPSGALVLTVQSVDGTNAPSSGTKTFYVPPFTETLTHPEYRLGVAGDMGSAQIIWHRTDSANDTTVFIASTAYQGAPITNTVAVSDFAGHTLLWEFTFGPQISRIEVLP